VTTPLTMRALLEASVGALRAAGLDTPRTDAEWLLAGLLGVGRFEPYLADRGVEPEAVARVQAAVARRARREPLQRIVGWTEFRGLRIGLDDPVLVPRPETEVLVEHALAALPPPSSRRPLVVDVGTGSGCIACALAVARPDVAVVAVDVAPAAAQAAAANVRALGLGGRVAVVVADLLGPLAAACADLVVGNLPYLPSRLVPDLPPEVRDHDPRLALDGGPDGLAVIRRLVTEAGRVLRADGVLCLETAGGGQARVVRALLAGRPGWPATDLRADLAGRERFVSARRASAAGERATCAS
jgi:release factor-specific protein-(glutamine-N5) methyltransferase